MKIIIHRGAQEVGGSCVEIAHRDATILLDAGLPLDFEVPVLARMYDRRIKGYRSTG
jgi:Cft2 family RNA processing exonuclease